jgi:hypothetical protein
MNDAENTDLSELDALKSAGDEALSHRAALQRSQKTLADALAVHLVERKRLEDELAASRAATKKAERESRSLRRQIAASRNGAAQVDFHRNRRGFARDNGQIETPPAITTEQKLGLAKNPSEISP